MGYKMIKNMWFTKYFKAFSLVEILVALIIISLIMAVMAPVVTKKLSSSGITISSSSLSEGNTQLSKICNISNCSVCSEDQAICYVCKNDFKLNENTCEAVENHNISSDCSSWAYCSACTSSECVACESGYFLNASGNCELIAQSTDVSAACNDIENCTMCYDGKCLACKSGYELINDGANCSNNATRSITSQEDCNPFNALYVPASYNGSGGKGLCVTKYNIGDPGGPPLDASVKSVVLGTCPVTSAGTNEANALCCWLGRTSASCTEEDEYGSFYSGCNRTVCQRGAASISCKNWQPDVNGYKISGWRLPTNNEITGWKNNISAISRKKGQNGLQLCAQWPTDSSMSIYEVQCATNFGGCKGAAYGTGDLNNCHPFDLWSATSGLQVLASTTNIGTFNPLYAFSGRCVIDSLPKNFTGSKSSNFAVKNTKRNIEVYGEPTKQADCDPFNALFIPRKYNGTINKNLCVTKHDVGMPGGPPLPRTLSTSPYYGVQIVQVGETCASSNCIWIGQTGKSCDYTVNDRGNPCERPVMGYHAAHYSCVFWNPLGTKHYNWQLPNYNTAYSWAHHYNNNIDNFREIFSLDENGLNVCADTSTNSKQLVCTHRSTSCPGAQSNECWPSTHWTEEGTYLYRLENATTIGVPGAAAQNWAFAARCISYTVPIK